MDIPTTLRTGRSPCARLPLAVVLVSVSAFALLPVTTRAGDDLDLTPATGLDLGGQVADAATSWAAAPLLAAGTRPRPARERDFGSGPFGFFKYLLWQVSHRFPYHGTWTGRLLFQAFAAAAFRISFWPFLWRIVRRDMNLLQAGRYGPPAQNVMTLGIELVGLVFAIFLLQDNRWLYGRLPSPGKLVWNSTAMHVVAWPCLVVALVPAVFMILFVALRHDGPGGSQPPGSLRPTVHPVRNLFDLFTGGGQFVVRASQEAFREGRHWADGPIMIIPLCLFPLWPIVLFMMFFKCFALFNRPEEGAPTVLHLWPLPTAFPMLWASFIALFATMGFLVRREAEPLLGIVAGLTLFTAPWILTEGARMVFVCVLHKRTFG